MKGEVRMRIHSLMPEKLIGRAAEAGVRFLSVEPEGGHATAVEVSARDAEILRALCERFSIPAEVVARRGRSALARRLRARWTLLAGLLTAAALCWLFLGHIWKIDIRFTGDAAGAGDAGTFSRALAEMGVRPGVSRSLDAARLSDELLAGAEGYSFVGARVEGVRLLVEAAPEVAAPEVYDVDAPRDLYASRTGIVTAVNVESGEPCVAVGDTVRRGQMLISGAEKASAEAERRIGALGEVVIRTWFEGSAEGSLYEAQLQYTGRQSVSAALRTPWFEIPLTEGARFESQSVETEELPVGGLFIPVRIVRETARETRAVREAGDRELLSSRLIALAMADARAALTSEGPQSFEIARSWIRFTQPSAEILRASAVCEIYMNAAVTREVLKQGG